MSAPTAPSEKTDLVRVPRAELERKLGPCFRTWVMRLRSCKRGQWITRTRRRCLYETSTWSWRDTWRDGPPATLNAHRWKRHRLRLRKIGLMHGTEASGVLRGNIAYVPPQAAAWLATANPWGGARPGAGRPGKESSRVRSPPGGEQARLEIGPQREIKTDMRRARRPPSAP